MHWSCVVIVLIEKTIHADKQLIQHTRRESEENI